MMLRIGIPILIIGAIIIILGIIFHLQGISLVGPESSFMYANPEWVNYGTQIAVSGVIIFSTGIAMLFLRKTNQ